MPSPSSAQTHSSADTPLPRCAVCGAGSRQPAFRPNPPEQAPDLDLRPGEPVRSTMARWLQQCPTCGYAAPDITRAHPAAAQAVEHYEMARYGTLKAWATLLGRTDAAQLLDATLKEEAATDKKLSGLAIHTENAKAA